MEQVETAMFVDGAERRVEIGATGVAADEVQLTLDYDELGWGRGRPGDAPLRIVSADWELDWRLVEELCTDVLSVAGAVPDGVEVEHGHVVVPLLQPSSISDDQITWEITAGLSLVCEHLDAVGFECAGEDEPGGASEVALSGSDVWRFARALMSLVVWLEELQGDIAQLARERRGQLRGKRRQEERGVFFGASSVAVEVEGGCDSASWMSVTGGRVSSGPLGERDEEVMVDLAIGPEVDAEGRAALIATLARLRGVVPPWWRRGLGRVEVPFLDVACAEGSSVAWEISEHLTLVAGETVFFALDGLRADGVGSRAKLTVMEVRLLLRALVSIDAWLREVEECARTAVVARRLERAAALDRRLLQP